MFTKALILVLLGSSLVVSSLEVDDFDVLMDSQVEKLKTTYDKVAEDIMTVYQVRLKLGIIDSGHETAEVDAMRKTGFIKVQADTDIKAVRNDKNITKKDAFGWVLLYSEIAIKKLNDNFKNLGLGSFLQRGPILKKTQDA